MKRWLILALLVAVPALGQEPPRQIYFFSPAWSPSGERLLFESDLDGDFELYMVKADGSGLYQFTDNIFDDIDGSWSPDGLRIAFASDQAGSLQVYTMRRDGLERTRITEGNGVCYGPAWSPDGTRIAFHRAASRYSNVHDLWMVNDDGTEARRLTTVETNDQYPKWSPDGEWILFRQEREGRSDLLSINGRVSATMLRVRVQSPQSEFMGDWSPDGGRVVFSRGVWPELNLYVRDLAARTDSVLVGGERNANAPAWSPDGAWIAYHARQDGRYGIYVIGADGTGGRLIMDEPLARKALER
jgi:Tol biopolymer transport system component